MLKPIPTARKKAKRRYERPRVSSQRVFVEGLFTGDPFFGPRPTPER